MTIHDATAPVFWAEGMSLEPQHFQATERFLLSQLNAATSGPLRWGVCSLVTQIGVDSVTVAQADIIMPDSRTSLTIPHAARITAGGFGDYFARHDEPLEVFVGIPLRQTDVSVVEDAGNRKARYLVEPRQVADENDPLESSSTVEFRMFNARLFLGKESRDGYETIKIGELVRPANSPRLTPTWSPAYVPPLMDITADAALASRLRELNTEVRDVAGELSRNLAARALTIAAEAGADAEAVLKLIALNTHGPDVELLTSTAGVHPFEAFRGLARLAGALAIHRQERRLPQAVRYQHDQLGAAFAAMTEQISELLRTILPTGWQRRRLDRINGRPLLECDFDPAWATATSDKDVYLAAIAPSIPPQELVSLVCGRVRLVAADDVELVQKNVLRGIRLVHQAVTPRRLPPHGGIQYFLLDRQQTVSQRWDSLEQSRRLSLIVDESDQALVMNGDLELWLYDCPR